TGRARSGARRAIGGWAARRWRLSPRRCAAHHPRPEDRSGVRIGGRSPPHSHCAVRARSRLPWRACSRRGAAMIRVLLAEDQTMVRGALAALLALEGDIHIVAEVARGDEVVTAALAAQPDVALLDIEMPGGDGLTAAAQVRSELPSCRVLILTTFGRPGYLRRAMESGAVGFLLKDAPAAQLAAAIRRA